MKQYIDKDALVAELERKKEFASYTDSIYYSALDSMQDFIDTLEVKEDGDNYLEKFKSLQHISGDLHQTLEDWGYAPNLYFFDGMWHVDWISCEEGDSIKGFTGDTAEEAINEACNWFHSTFCNG